MKFLYKSFWGKLFRKFLRKKLPARIVGWFQKRSVSKRFIIPFIKKHTIDMSDFQEPEGGYRSFNDFFIRKLKNDVRKIDPNLESIVSPCDGKVLVFDIICGTQKFVVKGVPFCLNTLFGDNKQAAEYVGGSMLIFRLAPYDYHRFHFPLTCIPSSAKRIAGYYESVNPFVYNAGVQPLTVNERHMISLQSPLFGDVAFFVVGAMFVGTIGYTYKPGQRAEKGLEMGYFSFGGSSLIMVFKESVVTMRPDLVAHSNQGHETAVLMGEMIAQKRK